jgi:hypothetical protein|tara:strand:- start:171 stop:956 length:786 start_codon:yes stop_codon:yes gene_type:complete
MSSKSGSTTTETALPDWLQGPVNRNIQRAEDLQKLPFMPYRGPEVAAFNDNQEAAFQNNNDAARAFGFNAPTSAVGGMPEATTYANGMKGYDSNSIYDQALLDSKAYDPVAWDKYQSLFDSSAPSSNFTSTTGGGGGGGGGNNAIDPNEVALQKLRDARANAGNTPTPMQNYLDDSQMSFSDPRKSPGHPSNYNYTPTAPTQIYNTSGGTPFDNPYVEAARSYENKNIGAMDIHSGSQLDQNLSNPIDKIMSDYYAKQAGK